MPMKLLLLSLLLAGSCTAAAQRRPTARELGRLQESLWQRLDTLRKNAAQADAFCAPENSRTGVTAEALRTSDHPGAVAVALRTPQTEQAKAVAEAVYASEVDDAQGVVVVHLIRADSAMRARFRRYVHDSPQIRLEGFDPDTTPYPPAPEGTPPPDSLTMRAQYAFYPADTDRIRLTIRYQGDSTVYFGTEYTVCRLQSDRWETLPVANAWNSLLMGIGRPEFPAPVDASQADDFTYDFTARLASCVYPAAYARYRICKKVYMENPRRDYLLTADFTLTPFVPFTRFSEQGGNNN